MNKKYEVIWASVAENDLARIIEYIANDNPANALKVLNKLVTFKRFGIML